MDAESSGLGITKAKQHQHTTSWKRLGHFTCNAAATVQECGNTSEGRGMFFPGGSINTYPARVELSASTTATSCAAEPQVSIGPTLFEQPRGTSYVEAPLRKSSSSAPLVPQPLLKVKKSSTTTRRRHSNNGTLKSSQRTGRAHNKAIPRKARSGAAEDVQTLRKVSGDCVPGQAETPRVQRNVIATFQNTGTNSQFGEMG